MAAQIQQQLLAELRKIDRPGTFCTSGRLPAVLPGLEVKGVGPVSLPLNKRDASAIKKQAHQAPYGKGTKTLVDTDVRRVWEIDADQIALANPEWPKTVEQAVHNVQTDLGLEKQKLQSHLYKLLLYESGSFFLPHRDGEKLDRMVATLVIVLPSAHQGGELVVRHEGQEQIVDFGPNSRFHTQFAGFYADCEHEIRPVAQGFRLALVYNLTLAKSKQTITAPTSSEHIAEVSRVLKKWKDEGGKTIGTDRTGQISKLAVLLEHKYSEEGLAADALKGIDRAKAQVLFAAAQQSGFDASLALVTNWVSGSAEPTGEYYYGGYERSRRWQEGDYDESEEGNEEHGEHTMGEIFDETLTAEHFSDAAGNKLAFDQIPLKKSELVSETPLDADEPDEEDFEGFTGNAGMTLERWYRRAAILLWPAESEFDVLCEAGMEAAVGGLEQMIHRWQKAKKSEQPILKQSCLMFASRIIAHWPEQQFGRAHYGDYGADDIDGDDEDEENDDIRAIGDDETRQTTAKQVSRSSLLSLLHTLNDASLIAAWLRGVLAKDASVEPGRTLGDLCQQHGWKTFRDELLATFEKTSDQNLVRHARLLADWSRRKDRDRDRIDLCMQLAPLVMSAAERWNREPTTHNWQARLVNPRYLLTPMLTAFLALKEPRLTDRLVNCVFERPKEFELTKVQIASLLDARAWLTRNVKHFDAPLGRWLTTLVNELENRCSHPPQEPADWQRASATGCNCADCKELSRFLKDPNLQTARFPLAKTRRQHLHRVIERNELDTTHATEHRGNPHVLVCTKTNTSYDQALKIHHTDLDHLTKIRNLRDWHQGLQMSGGKKSQKA